MSMLALIQVLSFPSKFWMFLTLLKLGRMEFHMTADLTKNDLLAMDDSALGTSIDPSSALLVIESCILE